MGGFAVTILIRLILYITYLPHHVTPNPLHTLLKAITRGFIALFHIGV
jgi:hypothetical protein